MSYFNVRVYGLLLNEQQEILLSDEFEHNTLFTKFPGGGLELGEGLIDGLKREYLEECNAEIEVLQHIYTTDFYEKSSFNDSQVISIYYLIKTKQPLQLKFKTKAFDFDDGCKQSFRWRKLLEIGDDDLTFRTDKAAIHLLREKITDFQ